MKMRFIQKAKKSVEEYFPTFCRIFRKNKCIVELERISGAVDAKPVQLVETKKRNPLTLEDTVATAMEILYEHLPGRLCSEINYDLKKKILQKVKERETETPLERARRIWKKKDDNKQQYDLEELCIAAKAGDLDKLRTLIQEGVDVNHNYNTRFGSGHSFGGAYTNALCEAVSAAQKDAIRLLVEYGANTTQEVYEKKVNRYQPGYFDGHFIPLACAVENSDIETTKLLIELGADVNQHHYMYYVPTEFGPRAEPKPTLIPIVVAVSVGTPEMISFLLDKGADPNVKEDKLLDKTIERGDPEVIALLLARNITIPDLGDTVLQAVKKENAEIVRMLLEKKESGSTETFESALITACEKGNNGILVMLLSAGAKPGQRALEVAIKRGDVAVVRAFLEHGARAQENKYCRHCNKYLPQVGEEIAQLLESYRPVQTSPELHNG